MRRLSPNQIILALAILAMVLVWGLTHPWDEPSNIQAPKYFAPPPEDQAEVQVIDL
jgi:hypothetical protein